MAYEGSLNADVEKPLLAPFKDDAKSVNEAAKNKDIPFWYLISMMATVLILFSMTNIIVTGFSESQRMVALACQVLVFLGILVFLYLEAWLGKYMSSRIVDLHKEMAAMVKISAEFFMTVGVYGMLVWNGDGKGNTDLNFVLLLGSTMFYISAFMGHVFQLGAKEMYGTFTAVCRTYAICVIFLGYMKLGLCVGAMYIGVTLVFYRLIL